MNSMNGTALPHTTESVKFANMKSLLNGVMHCSMKLTKNIGRGNEMLTRFETEKAYELVLDRLIEYENAYNIPHLKSDRLHHYEHLKSMSEYLADSLRLGATEVLLNIAEVNSLVKR